MFPSLTQFSALNIKYYKATSTFIMNEIKICFVYSV